MISPGYSQVFFSDKYKLIIGCHARCWSKSMNIWFGRLQGYDNDASWYTHQKTANDSNISLWCYDDDFIKEKFKDYKIYFFTRNPYERFYSHLLAHQLYQNVSFLEATKLAILNNNNKPEALYNKYSRKIIDNLDYEIVDFPNIRETLFNIKESLGIDIDFENSTYKKEYIQLDDYVNSSDSDIYDLLISDINEVPCHCSIPNYKLIYNDYISNIVYEYYKLDFEFFNYDKDFNNRDRLKSK